MKTVTNKLHKADDKKHSVVFKPTSNVENPIVTSVYIMKTAIPTGAIECKLTISWPEGGQDEAYLKV